MFTGIVECMGTIKSYKQQDNTQSGGNGISIVISDCAQILTDCHIGDSIAVNGICLTVTEFTESEFKVGISPETVDRTTIKNWKQGEKVNLERAISNEVRFGGHYVQGHVDCIANIVGEEVVANSIIFSFQLPNENKKYINYIVEKGFICIDGVSLTITYVDDKEAIFKIAMIKHTQENVILPLRQLNQVNIEVDLTGKIIEKQIVNFMETKFNNESDSNNVFNAQLIKLIDQRIDLKLKEYIEKK